MRDAFPPPIVVVEIVYVFRLCGIVCRWLMSFGWIVRKRLFCLCGMCGKILRSVVGAVPVCPPASPCKGAFVVHPSRTMRVFLLWKRHCANVRAGTQAPPLRVSFGWVMMCDEKEYNPQGGSLLAYIITQGRLRCTCQPCAIESKTALR